MTHAHSQIHMYTHTHREPYASSAGLTLQMRSVGLMIGSASFAVDVVSTRSGTSAPVIVWALSRWRWRPCGTASAYRRAATPASHFTL